MPTTSEIPAADKLLSSRKVAEMLGVSTVTLSRWRSEQSGPAYVRFSHCRVGYPLRAVQAWLDERRVG